VPAGPAAGLLRQSSEPCGNCDTCLTPPETWDGTIAAQKLLSTVYRLQRERNQRFGVGQSIDILLGKRTDKVLAVRARLLTVFGSAADLREAEWRAVARQLLAQGLLAVEGDYGAWCSPTTAPRPGPAASGHAAP
jgi:ATP-dependent DNA helicase RecQ